MSEAQSDNKKRTSPETLDEGVEILPTENPEEGNLSKDIAEIIEKTDNNEHPDLTLEKNGGGQAKTPSPLTPKNPPNTDVGKPVRSPKTTNTQENPTVNEPTKTENTTPAKKIPLGETPQQPRQQKETPKKESDPALKTVRTYQSDVADTLKNKKTSLAGMILAEKAKREKGGGPNTTEKKISKKMIIIGIVIAVLVIGGVAGFFALLGPKNTQRTEITELNIPNIIFPNYQREVFLKKLKKSNIVEAISLEKENISVPLGSITQIYLTKEDPSKAYVVEGTKGYKLLVTSEVLLKSLETRAPASMTRALGPDFMLGFHSSLGNNPFLLFKVNSYENVFAGMLDWERTMYSDLGKIFKREDSKLDQGAQTFKDIVITNRDVRAILNSQGKIEFAYSFPNKNTLIITNNETTLEELYRRTTTAQLERKD